MEGWTGEADTRPMSESRQREDVAPRLSVIVCTFNMSRAAPRTIWSAGVPYQQDVAAGDYEVIVVDNGSTARPTLELSQLPPGVRLVDMPDPQPSPVFAMNWAARELARGEILLFAIDGARIFSDHLYVSMLAAHDLVDAAFVYTLAWHLGPKMQMISTQEGYDEAAEDRLIAECGWPERPGGLYEISVFAGSSLRGFFQPVAESNAFSVRRRDFERMGGYDERFTSPGGGLCNLELFNRYVADAGTRNVCLLSEGTFHQVHDGIATSNSPQRWTAFTAEYERIFGHRYQRATYDALYFGPLRPEVRPFLQQSLERGGRPVGPARGHGPRSSVS
jgi:hypothetical protein